ncbi:14411_t:CDS:2, partial [Racocetra fulgida]
MEVATTQYEALKSFLEIHLANENADGARAGAKEKLNKLTQVQFYELSTDFPKPTPQYYPPNNKFNNYQPAAPGQTTIIPKTGTVKQEKIEYQIQKPTSRPGAPTADNNVESNPKPYVNGNHSNIPIPDSMPPEYGLSRAPRSRSQSTASSVSDIGHHYMSMASVTSSSSKGTRDTVNSQKLNFESLDNLMADLGDIIGHKKESVNSNGNSRIRSLENQLEELLKINDQQKSQLVLLEKEVIKLNEERQQQLEVTNDVKKEATSLLEEIKKLSMKNEELSSEKEHDSAKIISLTKAVDEWKSKYEKAKAEMNNMNEASFADVDMLKDYLERQTESIVQAIQTLLGSIRNGSYVNELSENIANIATIVANVISTCQNFFGSSSGALYRLRGDPILKDLENGVNKLGEMRETIKNDGESFMSNKASKQRLASASFDIAKFTKEL